MKSANRHQINAILSLASLTITLGCGNGFQMKKLEIAGVQLTSEAPLSAPQITVLTQVPADINSKAFSVSLSLALDNRAKLQTMTCQLDAAAAEDCSSGTMNLQNLTEGDHTVKINAQDNKGQVADEKILQFRVDTEAPVITISQSPAAVTGNSTIIAFAVMDATSGANPPQCSLNGAAFTNCASPISLTALIQGPQNYKIKVSDKAGNQSLEQSLTWTVNTLAPTVLISARPDPLTNQKTANFVFSGSAAGMPLASYECSIDGGAFVACSSPQSLSAISDGAHTFAVRGTSAGGVASDAVSATWTVDSVVPSTPVITANVQPLSTLAAASMVFSATDPGTAIKEYQCSLDNAAFAVCTSPRALSALANGAHSFRVKALDNAGNESLIQTFNWSVDATLPVLAFTATPAASTNVATANFTFTASDANSGLASVLCSLNNAVFAACTSPQNFSALALGNHTFSVRATDVAGNQRTITQAWVYETTPSIDGAALYTSKCSGCHRPLATSQVRGRSASLITGAISSVGAMSGLRTLTAAEIQAIAAALQ